MSRTVLLCLKGLVLRIDKYLKVSRLIKRRTVANQACDSGHVSVNGKVVKASFEVKEGDIVSIAFGEKELKVKVVSVMEHALKSEASLMYEAL